MMSADPFFVVGRANDRAEHSKETALKAGTWRALLIAAGLLTLGALVPLRDATAVLVHIDTSMLAGTSATLEFTLFEGDAVPGNNTVTISGLATDGTFQGTDCTFGCTGGPPYVIDEANGAFGQFRQDLLLGAYVDFELSFTTNFSGAGVPDLLVLNLLDQVTSLTLVDTDLDALNAPIPYQDAMLLLSLTGNGNFQLPTVVTPGQPPLLVPEPPALALVALAVSLFAVRRRRGIAAGGAAA